MSHAMFSAEDVETLLRSAEKHEIPDDEECEHADMDDGICLDCGADRTEELAARAYDRAKDFRKYGNS